MTVTICQAHCLYFGDSTFQSQTFRFELFTFTLEAFPLARGLRDVCVLALLPIRNAVAMDKSFALQGIYNCTCSTVRKPQRNIGGFTVESPNVAALFRLTSTFQKHSPDGYYCCYVMS